MSLKHANQAARESFRRRARRHPAVVRSVDRTCMEGLERRELLATFTVININDAGGGSLRQAIISANAASNADTIVFNIPGAGPHTITPASQLPIVTQPVEIDATSEILSNGTRGVELNGASAGLADGLLIDTSNVTVRGLAINRFSDSGIKVLSFGNTNALITGCYIGTDPTGLIARGNGGDGIELTESSGIIGGALASERNVISANGDRGVRITGSLAGISLVLGNYIGIASDGITDLGNAQHGVQLSSSDNRVGGAGGQRNVISGNGGDGVRIERQIFGSQFGPEANDNTVTGNYIGTEASGGGAVRNEFHGVQIVNGSRNTIGSADATGRNVISGNRRRGVTITAISAPGLSGISQDNVVIGNYIGLAVNGEARPNLLSGVGLFEDQGASEAFVLSNRIGGSAPGEGNVISSNGAAGVAVADGAAGTTIQGNYIGTDPTGTQARPNLEAGVFIGDSQGNTVGGRFASQRNVISGNDDDGVRIISTGAAPTPANSNLVFNNYIGTNAAGTAALGNSLFGVRIVGGSSNQIGDTFVDTGNAGNVISGNALGGIGIGVDTPDFTEVGTTANNVIQNNFIGTNAAVTAALPNVIDGVNVMETSSVPTTGTLIGGTGSGVQRQGNLISGNGTDGQHAGIRVENGPATTSILGNRIGTNAAGNAVLGTFGNFGRGIFIRNASTTTIGSTASGGGNVVAGSGGAGIVVSGDSLSLVTTIAANAIGTDLSGVADLGNGGSGIVVTGTLDSIDRDITIGGSTDAAGNRIAFNNFGGISVNAGSGTEITRNRIYSNAELGIDLSALGVTFNDPGDTDIGPNGLQNFPILSSSVSVASGNVTIPTTFNSALNTTFRFDYYAVLGNPDPSGHGEGEVFLGSSTVTTNGAGSASASPTFSLAAAPVATHISATATRTSDGSTSEFATNVALPDTTAPAVNSSALEFQTRQAIAITFSEPLNPATVSANDLSALNLDDNLTPAANSVFLSAGNTVATWVFNPPGAFISDGDYSFTLAAGAVSDVSGNPLGAAYNLSGTGIFFLGGDANHDRRVNLVDYNILAGNFSQSPRTFGQGDFNYDSLVNLADYNILAGRFGTQLGPDGELVRNAGEQLPQLASASPFGDGAIIHGQQKSTSLTAGLSGSANEDDLLELTRK